MVTTIQFNFALDKGRLEVLLEADFEPDERGIFYQVKNFRLPGSSSTHILPEIKIKKKDGHWVHSDSGWRTELSEAVGKAIEEAGLAPGPTGAWEMQSLAEDDEQETDTAEGAA